jgi:hypothetical protein
MASVLTEPQFQIFTHPKTGAKVGRIYFPALFLAEFHTSVAKWLQRGEIIFDENYVIQNINLYNINNNPIILHCRM